MKLGFSVPFVMASVLAFASCDKSSTQPTTPPPDGDAITSDAGADDGEETGDVPWAQMSFDQRKKYMAKKVLPAMKTAFSGHDADLFKGFKCETCHGDDETYAMPNAGIYPLDPNDPIAGAMEYDEKVTKFMIDEIVPQMAELIGTEPVSADNPDGMGCMSCHPAE
jgi:hypothetical protein